VRGTAQPILVLGHFRNIRDMPRASLVQLSVLVALFGCSARTGVDNPEGVHADVVARLGRVPGEALPAGDTLVSWARSGPVLYHTVQVRNPELRSSMTRNDDLTGVLVTQHGARAPQAFRVLWREGTRTTVDRGGVVRDSVLAVTGDTALQLPLPATDWGIADYGMEEHLLPVALRGDRTGRARQLLVLRPYGLKWDTVAVSVVRRGDYFELVLNAGAASEEELLATADGHLLGRHRRDGSLEQRPLEFTPMWKVWRLAVAARSSRLE
jgi:hypothetical protein